MLSSFGPDDRFVPPLVGRLRESIRSERHAAADETMGQLLFVFVV